MAPSKTAFLFHHMDWFYIQPDTKEVILETSSQLISRLSTEKLNLTQQKQTYIRNKIYYNTK